jgi:hypothetical protein
MQRLIEEQVELAERYAAALETIERLRGLLPSEEEACQIDEYQQNLAYIVDHHDDWSEADAERAADYAGNLSEIARLYDDCMNADAVQEAANYARDLHEIAELAC